MGGKVKERGVRNVRLAKPLRDQQLIDSVSLTYAVILRQDDIG